MPRRRASSTSPNRSTLPPPDLGFISRTGRAAGPTGLPGVGACFSEAMSRPSAYLVAAAAISSSATSRATASRLPTAASWRTTAVARAATASTAAPARSRPVRVIAKAAADTPTATHTAAASSTSGRRRSTTTTTASRASGASSATTAPTLRAGDTDRTSPSTADRCILAAPAERHKHARPVR
jgi:hypothetical protein